MRHALQWILSVIFVVQMYLAMILIALAYTPAALVNRDASMKWMKVFAWWVRVSAHWIVGLKTEIRGTPPGGPALVASKHQSFLDSIVLVSALPAPRFIMKRELSRIPLMGWHAVRAGFIPVDRGKRGAAIKKMMADVKQGAQREGQLIIYPQGTRVAPGLKLPYKTGTGVIYGQLGQTCYPVATNVGFFWPRQGIYRKRGTAVFEFLPPIEAGMTGPAFMAELALAIETASDRLLQEARRG